MYSEQQAAALSDALTDKTKSNPNWVYSPADRHFDFLLSQPVNIDQNTAILLSEATATMQTLSYWLVKSVFLNNVYVTCDNRVQYVFNFSGDNDDYVLVTFSLAPATTKLTETPPFRYADNALGRLVKDLVRNMFHAADAAGHGYITRSYSEVNKNLSQQYHSGMCTVTTTIGSGLLK